MVDLEGKDKGNISLPSRLQSPDVLDPNFVDDEHTVPIINMQKVFYDIQISDKEKRIGRLEDRNLELLEISANTEASINSLDIETGDHAAHLNRQLAVQTDKIDQILGNINFVEKLRHQEKQIHLNKVNSIDEKYETTRLALTSSIKALNARINSLDDYKQTRDDLREKLRIRDETMAENEDRVTRRLNAVARKFKIDRDKLKNEMYSRLLALAGSFQIEMSNSTAVPVRRLIRENIFIKNELTKITNESLKKKEDYTIIRSVEHLRSNSMNIDCRNKIDNLKTAKLQKSLIDALKYEHLKMKKRVENIDIIDEFTQEKWDNIVDSARLELRAFAFRTSKLEVLLHWETVKLNRVKFIHSQTEVRAKKYEDILYDLKYAVACALKTTDGGKDVVEMSAPQLISHLRNIIVRGNSQIRCLEMASAESVPRPNDAYARGDLNFEPSYINFEDSTIERECSENQSLRTTDVANASQLLPIVLPRISQNNGSVWNNVEQVSTGGTSETAISDISNYTKEETSDLPEIFSLNRSTEANQTFREIEQSVNEEFDDEGLE